MLVFVAGEHIEESGKQTVVEGGEEPFEPEPIPPVPSEDEGEPVTPAPSDSEVEPEPEVEALTIYVSTSVGEAGLRLRKIPRPSGALVAVEKAGTALTVLEPAKKARNKIGKRGKWIHVSDPKRLQGYVSAIYVELEVAATEETPAPISEPEVEPESLTVYVSSAASAGLRMRDKPTTNSSTLMILPPGAELKVLEGTADLVGVYGKWLKVRETGGAEGYVAAWYVRK